MPRLPPDWRSEDRGVVSLGMSQSAELSLMERLSIKETEGDDRGMFPHDHQ